MFKGCSRLTIPNVRLPR
ncbi:unnamed protein product, partial [Rotaria sp. Silwood2]